MPAKAKPFKGAVFRGHRVATDDPNGRCTPSTHRSSWAQLPAGLSSCLEHWLSAMSTWAPTEPQREIKPFHEQGQRDLGL